MVVWVIAKCLFFQCMMYRYGSARVRLGFLRIRFPSSVFGNDWFFKFYFNNILSSQNPRVKDILSAKFLFEQSSRPMSLAGMEKKSTREIHLRKLIFIRS